MKIKLFDVNIGKGEELTIQKVLKSRFWASGAGIGNVEKFENSFQDYIHAKNCIAVNSGTSALNLALSLINLKNKEVIVPSLTFVSSVHAIVLNGGKPVFADVDPNTLCIDPKSINDLISKKTTAVLPVHFAGMPCELGAISNICKKNNLSMIEDAAHAAGTTYKNKKIGSHGSSVCFSFHPVKNLAMPTGGLIALNDKDHHKQRKLLESRRWCGISDRRGVYYDVKEMGWNYYMNEFSASIGLLQLKKLDHMNNLRKKIAYRYHKEIKLEKKIPFDKNCSYHIFWIRVKNRTKFMQNMAEKGIETGIHYNPVHKTTLYHNTRKLPITEKISKEIVSIPMHANLNNSAIDYVISTINKLV
jgi:dTDP-4-amino-4,6-dideoxygalactose transaminase